MASRPKKMMNMYILDILKRYSDIEHPMTQKQIQDKLESDYDMIVDRKAVKANLLDFITDGTYGVEYLKEDIRMTPDKNGEMMETTIYSDFYYESPFTDSELRWLIDSVLFSKNIPTNNKKGIINNLKDLTSHNFKFAADSIHSFVSDEREINSNLFVNLELIDEAIKNDKKIVFNYNEYGTDKKLHPRKNDEGNIREYVMNPYYMAVTAGKYFLICNSDKYNNISNYRIDRISNIRILDEPRKDKKDVEGLVGFDIQKYMSEHIYMFHGKSITASFEMPKILIPDILDFFRSNVKFKELGNDKLLATVKVNEQDMRLWAKQYSGQIKVTQPKELIDLVKQDLQEALAMYED